MTKQIKNKKKKPWYKTKRTHRVLITTIAVIAAFFIGKGVQSLSDKSHYSSLLEQQKTEYEDLMNVQQESYEQAIADLRIEYETPNQEKTMKQEAEYLAKLLYGTARNNTTRDQKTLIWCALNRVESAVFPNTVQEVCAQAGAFINYNDNNPILTNLYEVALGELEKWYNNERPVNSSYVYMDWSAEQIILRDTYKITNSTHYWQSN